jgi:ankyrin repeat protein
MNPSVRTHSPESRAQQRDLAAHFLPEGMKGFHRSEPVYSPTPLHDAAQAGDVDGVERALAAGAEPNAKTLFALTPLHLAARVYGLRRVQDMPAQRWSAIVDLLLAAGANPTARDWQGSIPAKWCEGFQPPGLLARMKALSDSGEWKPGANGAARNAGRAWKAGVRVGIKVPLDRMDGDDGVSRKSGEDLPYGNEEGIGKKWVCLSDEAASFSEESDQGAPVEDFGLAFESEGGRGWDC